MLSSSPAAPSYFAFSHLEHTSAQAPAISTHFQIILIVEKAVGKTFHNSIYGRFHAAFVCLTSYRFAMAVCKWVQFGCITRPNKKVPNCLSRLWKAHHQRTMDQKLRKLHNLVRPLVGPLRNQAQLGATAMQVFNFIILLFVIHHVRWCTLRQRQFALSLILRFNALLRTRPFLPHTSLPFWFPIFKKQQWFSKCSSPRRMCLHLLDCYPQIFAHWKQLSSRLFGALRSTLA